MTPREDERSHAVAAGAGAALADWPRVWAGCARRIRSWRVPPRWSTGDWHDELRAQAAAAAWQAAREFEPARGVPFLAFVHRRALSGALTRSRQEWSYARHLGLGVSPGEIGDREGSSSAVDLAWQALQGPLGRLAEADRWLIECLFWEGWTEARVAGALGISQPAVSKRKRLILGALRRDLGDLDLPGPDRRL